MFMTQLESAVAGVVTKEMKVVAEKERMDEEVLCSLVAAGKVVIPCNKQKTSLIMIVKLKRLIELFDLEQRQSWIFPLMVIPVFSDVN